MNKVISISFILLNLQISFSAPPTPNREEQLANAFDISLRGKREYEYPYKPVVTDRPALLIGFGKIGEFVSNLIYPPVQIEQFLSNDSAIPNYSLLAANTRLFQNLFSTIRPEIPLHNTSSSVSVPAPRPVQQQKPVQTTTEAQVDEDETEEEEDHEEEEEEE